MSDFMVKLVRDKIEERPGMTISHCSNDVIYAAMLNTKLVEECKEAVLSTNRDDFVKELADIAEVIEAMMTLLGISADELIAAKTAKFEERGGFSLRKIALIGKVNE